MDWETIWRDFSEQPLFSPVFNLWHQFFSIHRYPHMPFYIYPAAKSWISFEDTIITFMDWLVDAHEIERNKHDQHRSFYQRCSYVMDNYLRYQNDTMCNLMYDTKLRKTEYDRLNSIIKTQNTTFYASLTALHTVGFAYLAYFFRYRRVTLLPTLLIASGYYYFFTKVNNIAYKLLVDQAVIAQAR